MKKTASILDYSYPYLDPAVWDQDLKLYTYQKDFILRLLNSMYENYQLKQPEAWITDIQIIGSLTTSKWLFTSDLDVHLHVDLAKFIELNMPGTDPKVAFEYLDSTRKEFDRAKILAPMTQHPIEYYFEVPEMVGTNTSIVGIYSIPQEKWLKDPVFFEADVDFEESKKAVVEQAEALVTELEGSFAKIDSQIKRIEELERVITAWGPEKQQLFYNKIEEKLKIIEQEILKNLQLRQELIDTRHEAQDPMADIEIKFKWLQRFGLFGILSNLKNLMKQTDGKVTVQELPLIQKIVTKEAFIKEALDDNEKTIFVDFDDTVADEHEDHSIGNLLPGAKETIKKLREKGFKVIIDSARANEEKGKKEIEEFLKKNDVEVDGFYEGEKPLAFRYIDDRAIEFNGTWDGILEKIEKAKKNASLRIYAAQWPEAAWIAPDGQVYDAKPSHDLWMTKNIDLLQQRYNFDMSRWINDDDDMWDAVYALIKTGWSRLSIASDRSSYMVETASIKSIPQAVFDVLVNSPASKFYIEEVNGPATVELSKEDLIEGQNGVNRALQRKRMQGSRAFSKRDIVAKTKKVKQGDYSCVMALVPHDLAQEIVEWGVRNVPDEELYLSDEGKLGRELESHVTIYYGLLTNDAKAVRRSFNDDKPYKAKLGKVRHFEPPELPFDVLTIEVISEDLNKANERTRTSFKVADDLPSNEYKSHITIAYMKRGKAKDYIGYDGFEGKEIELDTLVFSPHRGNRTYFSIAHDKHSAWILEKINKFASHDVGLWIDPKGTVYDSHGEGLIHNEWIAANLDLLRKKYNLNIPDWKYVKEEANNYFQAISEGHDDNIELPDVSEVWVEMLNQGWVRIGDADEGVAVEVRDLRQIPSFVDSILIEYLRDGETVQVENLDREIVHVKYPFKNLQQAVNQALSSPNKTASVEQVETSDGARIPVLVNPSAAELLGLANRAASHSLRGLVDPHTGDLYAWEAHKSIHTPMIFALGLDMDYNAYNGLTSKHILHFSGDSVTRMLDFQKEVQQELQSVNASQEKAASGDNFLPSLFNAPNNEWQFQHGGDDQEIGVDPDPVSDESTWYAPCTEGKPRTKEVWRQFMSMFRNPFSKKEDVKIESAQEDLVTVGTFNAGKHGKFPIEVPQDLLDKYFSSVIYFKQLMKQGPDKVKELDKLDRERGLIHNQLMDFAFHRIAGPDKKPQDFPMAAGNIRHQISEFIESMVPREDLKVDSAYNPKLEEEEKKSLGEDQTLLEYMKDMPDPTKKDFPHNTTWDPIYQDGEPSKPGMPVTYSPQISNDDNLDQNSPDGFPRRFMGKPKGEWTSNQGEVNDAIIDMLRRRHAALDVLTKDITKEAFLEHAYWIDPNGKVYEVRGAGEFDDNDYTHYQWVRDNARMLVQEYGITDIDPENYVDSLVNHGWTRIGDSINAEQWQVQTPDLRAIPKAVDNLLAQFAPDGSEIDFADTNENFVTLTWPWKNSQAAVNRALRQSVPMAASLKQAGIERVDDVPVLVNPSQQEIEALARKLRGDFIRGLIDPNTGDMFIWDAYFKEHQAMIAALGIDMLYSMDSPNVLYFTPDEIPMVLERQRYIKQQLAQKRVRRPRKQPAFASLNKNAGNQSASVPDYLMDEWKTDQINNDTDEEPYRTHDQRDYPYGMHDSPENTDSNIGWAKDNQPYVVRLDILENPAYRLDPFGIGEYNVTWYESLPAGDGIEKTNP